jgi:hypothetical protein
MVWSADPGSAIRTAKVWSEQVITTALVAGSPPTFA